MDIDREESDSISLGFRVHKTKHSLTFELYDIQCTGENPLDSIQWFGDIWEHDLGGDIGQLEEIQLFGETHKWKHEELIRVEGVCCEVLSDPLGYTGFRIDHISLK